MSFPEYPAYRESGISRIGLVPIDWITKPLKYVASCNNEVLSEGTDEDTQIEYVEISDVDSVRGIINSSTFAFSAAPSRARRLVRDQDVLISTVRTYLRAIAPVSNPPENLVVSTGFAVIRPDLGNINGGYLGYLARSDEFVTEVIARSVGVSYPAINASEIMRLPVPLPACKEQTQIARFLDHETAKIDALIHEQERLIELLQEKRQAVISHAVTKGLDPDVPMKDSGVGWLGEVPAHWIVAGFKKHLEPIVDYRGKTPTKTESGVFLVTARNIKNGVINYSLSQEFISESDYEEVMRRGAPAIGDVLFTTEAPLGEVAQVDDETIALAQRIIKFRGLPGIIDNSYLKLFLQSASFQHGLMMFATGSTALGIKSDRLGHLRQLVPPFVEQQSIVKVVNQKVKEFERLMDSVTEAVDLMRERRSALISAAVTGKIDVRDWQPPADESAYDEEVRQTGMEATV
jgi:type I restriction enzyme S subunit